MAADLIHDARDLGAILARVGEGISIQEPGGALVYANPAALELIGYRTLDELLATPVAQVLDRFELLDEDGSPLGADRLPGRLALRRQTPPPVLLRFRVKATGEERYAVVRSEPILDERGELVYVVNTFHDQTDEQHTQRSLRFLADAGAALSTSLDYEETLRNLTRLSVPVLADWCAIDVLDADGEVHRVGIHHRDPAKLALAEELQQRFPPAQDTRTGVAGVLASGRSLLVEEITDAQIAEWPDVQLHGAEYLHLLRSIGLRSLIIAPLLASDRVIGALTLVSTESGRRYGRGDLSVAELLGMRAGLAVQNSRLYHETERAVALRDRFLQVAAHELLTPITIVRGYAQSLQRLVQRQLDASPGGESVTLDRVRLQRSLSQVDRAADRLSQLVGDLLDVTRLQGGSLVATRGPVNLSALVSSAVDAMRVQQAEGRYASDVELALDLPEGGSVIGSWDELRLEQVIFNVLDNAVKYSSAGGRVRLQLGIDGDEARIDVSDAGLGIPADQLVAIFEPFHRTSNANAHASGMGMGLAVCREIVNIHDGWIRAASPGIGRGSTFSIGLPGASLQASPPESQAVDAEAPPS